MRAFDAAKVGLDRRQIAIKQPELGFLWGKLMWKWLQELGKEKPTELIGVCTGLLTLITAIIVIFFQHSQNKMVQRQLELQQEQTIVAAEQFRVTRTTELTRILYEPQQSATVRTAAVRELIENWEGGYPASGNDERRFEDRFNEYREDASKDHREHYRDLILWHCIKISDTGGGSSSTERRILNLRGANLEGADLSDLSVRCVDLSGANLTGAVLKGAYFQNVLLNDVRFKDAHISSTSAYWIQLSFVDLDHVQTKAALSNWYTTYAIVPCAGRTGRISHIETEAKCN